MSNKVNFDLLDKVVMVTGAGKGIGKSIAIACAAAGADLALGSRTVSESEQTAEACRKMGSRVEVKHLDVTDIPSIKEFVAKTLETFGRINVLVNNAGYNKVMPALDVTEAVFEDICETNFKGTFFTSTIVAKSMIEQEIHGRIINISSQVGLVGGPLRAVYSGAKGAVNQISKSLALEWAKHGITVNAVAPTFTRTPMLEEAMKNPDFRQNIAKVPLGRPAEPEEIAGAVIYLASQAGGMVTGHTLVVDGGWTAI